MCEEKKFSVIVPIFNRGNTIAEVIESALAQTYSNWQLLLIDDGSTDSTRDICTSFANEDSRIRYIYKPNGGVSSARNMGIKQAEGEYIVFMDSDNTMLANMLEELQASIHLADNPDIITFGFNSSSTSFWQPVSNDVYKILDEKIIHDIYLPTHLNIYEQDSNFLLNYVWNKSFKREFLTSNSIYFDEMRRTWEDGIFVIECLSKATQIILIPTVIYNAFCDVSVDHLSSKLFPDQLLRYVNDEKRFKELFENDYNFNNEHYCYSNFRVIKQLLELTINTYSENVGEIVNAVVEMPIVEHWANHLRPLTKEDLRLQKLLIKKDPDAIIQMYKVTVLKKAVIRIKQKLNRLAKCLQK